MPPFKLVFSKQSLREKMNINISPITFLQPAIPRESLLETTDPHSVPHLLALRLHLPRCPTTRSCVPWHALLKPIRLTLYPSLPPGCQLAKHMSHCKSSWGNEDIPGQAVTLETTSDRNWSFDSPCLWRASVYPGMVWHPSLGLLVRSCFLFPKKILIDT